MLDTVLLIKAVFWDRLFSPSPSPREISLLSTTAVRVVSVHHEFTFPSSSLSYKAYGKMPGAIGIDFGSSSS